jgi:hypothetical protein
MVLVINYVDNFLVQIYSFLCNKINKVERMVYLLKQKDHNFLRKLNPKKTVALILRLHGGFPEI